MLSEEVLQDVGLPLAGCRVLEHSRTAAAAYAGRLLAAMGATVVMAEPPAGSTLRSAPPLLEGTTHSALFAYLAAGKRSLVCDLSGAVGQGRLERELELSEILIDDTPVGARPDHRLDQDSLAKRFPHLVQTAGSSALNDPRSPAQPPADRNRLSRRS